MTVLQDYPPDQVSASRINANLQADRAGTQCSPAGPLSIISGHVGEYCVLARKGTEDRGYL